MTDTRRRIKLAVERLSDLEEQLAQARHHAIAGDAEASAACAGLLDEIESAKLAISEWEEHPLAAFRSRSLTKTRERKQCRR